jgi:hypothetical protein
MGRTYASGPRRSTAAGGLRNDDESGLASRAPTSLQRKPPEQWKRSLNRDELLQLLTEKAREGSVYAARCLLDELRRDEQNDLVGDGGWDEIYGDGFGGLDAHSNIVCKKARPASVE